MTAARPTLCCVLLFLCMLCAVPARGARLNLLSSVDTRCAAGEEVVTLQLKRPTSFKSRALDRNTNRNRPHRLYIDLLNTSCGRKITPSIAPDSPVIAAIRTAQRNPTTTRVVFDMKNRLLREDYSIEQRDNPPRIEIRFRVPQPRPSAPARGTPPAPPQRTPVTAPPAAAPPEPAPVDHEAATHLPRTSQPESDPDPVRDSSDRFLIVVDPGHGGKDPGAIGHRGVKEKDVALSLALVVRDVLEKTIPDCRVVMTRETDRFLSLDKRGDIANQLKADLFVSIHANSHVDCSLRGIETYYLNFSSDETARKVAARENFTTPQQIGDLEMILFDLMQSDKINKSSILAGFVHNCLVSSIERKHRDLRNLGVKHAPMRVLINAEMPCVLIETAFISNPRDAGRLKSSSYQKLLAQGLADGIREYRSGYKTALYQSGAGQSSSP